jgi:plastocyanin
MTEHKVYVRVKERKLEYNRECLCVFPGDTIKWKLSKKCPFGIVIKALASPLDWCHKTSVTGEEITAKVLKDAAPGLYPYAFGAFIGTELLIDDPEIIVRPPR